MSAILTAIIAFISIILPGFFLALALLKKTKLNMFEIVTIGFMFGIIFPPTLTWFEAYLIPYMPAFSFSSGLYFANVALLTVIGVLLCFQQGALSFGSIKSTMASAPGLQKTEADFLPQNAGTKKSKMTLIWAALIVLMLFSFATRMLSIGIASHFFEFDPYFDMQSTEFLLSHGYQWLYDHSAWPTAINGTPHRIEPIVPYLEAFWYQISNPPNNQIDQTLLADVSSFYPAIVAALLVFVVFQFLYHLYGEYPALVGAALATAMPALITTFIAGEQLVEPWGIFAMFFFYAAYLLAVQNMKEPRFAILAGIAFAASFLGAHYYTVIAGVLAACIGLQGVMDLLRGSDMQDFYRMNVIVIGIIAFFYIIFDPYNTVLTNKIPSYAGVPVIVSFPLLALIIIFVAELLIKKFSQKLEKEETLVWILSAISVVGIFGLLWAALTSNLKKWHVVFSRYSVISVCAVIAVLLVFLTPLGKPIEGYLTLSSHFTTPSIPLFMTVQEYAPTGVNFDFGAAGFGAIGASININNSTYNVIVWLVLIIFIALACFSIYSRNSRGSVLALSAILPLTVAGMIEIKYLPHLGVGYIIAFCMIIGELFLLTESSKDNEKKFQIAVVASIFGFLLGVLLLVYAFPSGGYALATIVLAILVPAALIIVTWNYGENLAFRLVLVFCLFVTLMELSVFANVFSAATNPSCSALGTQGNAIGSDLYCNIVPPTWLSAASWMAQNVGPMAPRILSWWDYGDWINWFGNSNAVLRGDNSIAALDYQTASNYVLGAKSGFGPSALENFSNNVAQAKYVLFDDQLTAKWQALNFLACVNVNQTSRAYAISQAANTSSPYILGTSQCELSHVPAYITLPLNAQNINNYCQFKNKTIAAFKSLLLVGTGFANETLCVPQNVTTSGGAVRLLDSNGNPTNILLIPQNQFFAGVINLGGQQFADFMAIYLPNGPNNTITNAPTGFYDSNYYRGFYLGDLPGFHIAYPSNFNGINYVNGTWPVVIYQINNYTGALPYVTPKPAFVHNNFTMPG